MMDWLIDNLVSYGVFAALFSWLLYRTDKRNEAREEKYDATIERNQKIISEQAKSFSSLSGDVREIKVTLERGGHR